MNQSGLGSPNLQSDILLKLEENSENVPVDLRQEPTAFPKPTLFNWNKDRQPLTDLPLTYSNVTFGTVRRADAGNYTVSATNFVIRSPTEQVGNDTGSFHLDVICELCMYCSCSTTLIVLNNQIWFPREIIMYYD